MPCVEWVRAEKARAAAERKAKEQPKPEFKLTEYTFKIKPGSFVDDNVRISSDMVKALVKNLDDKLMAQYMDRVMADDLSAGDTYRMRASMPDIRVTPTDADIAATAAAIDRAAAKRKPVRRYKLIYRAIMQFIKTFW